MTIFVSLFRSFHHFTNLYYEALHIFAVSWLISSIQYAVYISPPCVRIFWDMRYTPLISTILDKDCQKRTRKLCCFSSAMRTEVGENPSFLQRISFPDECCFSVAWFCKTAKLQDWGLPMARNGPWVTAELSNGNSLVRYPQKWGNRALSRWCCYWRQLRKALTVSSFSKACQLPLQHDLLKGWGFSALQ